MGGQACYHYAVTVAFTLPGNLPVYTFSLLIGLGASLGIGRLTVRTAQEDRSTALLSAGIILIAALAGARLFYQFNHPAAALGLPLAGLSWIGAWVGGLAALLVLPALAGISFGALADSLVPTAAALTTAAWLGCWLDGCAYGPVTDAWYGLAARDEWGNIAIRFPVQLLGATLALLTLGFFDLIRRRDQKPGRAGALWLLLTGAQMLWLQSLRADPGPGWGAFDPNLLGASGLLLFGIAFLLKLLFEPE